MSKSNVLLIFVGCLVLSSCSPPQPAVEAEASIRPHVILISLDTLRQDHVGAYMPEGESLTPNLDEFAASAVVFEEAFAQIAFTLPSHLSMFTSLYPDVHGVERKTASLAEHVPTLPVLLKEAGYRNLGVVANTWMKAEFGFARGFDNYLMMTFELTFADRLNRTVKKLLDAPKSQGVPLFMFLHYFDAHSDFYNVAENALPYYAPPEFLESLGIDVASRVYCTEADECATGYLLAANRDDELVSDEQLAEIVALYQVGVRYLDHELGALFDDLKTRGLWDDSIIIITADHGEQFREHGELIHNQAYREDLAVPLMIKLPENKWAGERRQGLVETVDILPTILELVGVETPDGLQGQSMVSMIEAGAGGKLLALGRHKTSPRRYALRDERFCLVHDFALETSELYDRLADPDELINVSQRFPEDLERLLGQLTTLVEANKTKAEALASAKLSDASLVTEEEAEQLRAIGYTD